MRLCTVHSSPEKYSGRLARYVYSLFFLVPLQSGPFPKPYFIHLLSSRVLELPPPVPFPGMGDSMI